MRRFAIAAFVLACVTLSLTTNTFRGARAQQQRASLKATASTALEQEVVNEINLARTRPAEYAAYLEKLRPLFVGKEYRRPGKPALITEEGAAALEEAIGFLRAAKPLPAFNLSQGMCSSARELVKDQAGTAMTGHRGKDGSLCEQRTQRFGAWSGPIGENLNYSDDTARERVLTLLIDDGVANRGHRLRIFNPEYKVLGVACGSHQLGAMCVITFAGGFSDRAGAPSESQPGKKDAPAKGVPAGARRF